MAAVETSVHRHGRGYRRDRRLGGQRARPEFRYCGRTDRAAHVGADRHVDIRSERLRREQGARARMLDLLSATGDIDRTVCFLRKVLLDRYGGGENENLVPALDLIGPEATKRFLLDLIGPRFARRPVEMVDLVRRLHEKRGGPANRSWGDALRHCVRAILLALPAALSRTPTEAMDGSGTSVWREPISSRPKPIGHQTIRDVFALAWRWRLTDEADVAARAVADQVTDQTDAAFPGRALPIALRDLSREEGLADTNAFATLWRHATEFLLARSGHPPEEPRDWVITAEIDCDCELCEKLQGLLPRPRSQDGTFSAAQGLARPSAPDHRPPRARHRPCHRASRPTLMPPSRIHSSAPRTARPTSGDSSSTPRTLPACAR